MGDTSEPVDSATAAMEEQPKLSPADRKLYNRMATHMDLFHNNFRQMWNQLYTACTSNRRPQNLSLLQFLLIGENFCRYLTTHHTIEELHIFPVLATKMDCFKENNELITQHQGIHEGLERFEEYLGSVRRGEKELRLEEMKEVMDGFGEVLWEHLDQEVEALGAESMCRYWSREEMMGMPMGID